MMGIIFAALLVATGFMIVMWYLDKHFDKPKAINHQTQSLYAKKQEIDEQINKYVKYYTGVEISKLDSYIETHEKILLCLDNMENEINKK